MEQIIWESIKQENGFNRIVDEIQSAYETHKEEKTLALDVVRKMIADLASIKNELYDNYKVRCLELLSDLKDDLYNLNADSIEIKTEQATMISGHIY